MTPDMTPVHINNKAGSSDLILTLLSWQIGANLGEFSSSQSTQPERFHQFTSAFHASEWPKLSIVKIGCDKVRIKYILRHSSPQSRSISLCTTRGETHISKQYSSYLNVYFIQSVRNINTTDIFNFTQSTNIIDQNLTEGSNILRKWLIFILIIFSLIQLV